MAMQARSGRGRHGWLDAVAPILAVLLLESSAGAGALERAMLGKSAIVELTHAERPPMAESSPPSEPAAAKDFGTRLNGLGVARKDKSTVAGIAPHELLAPAVVVNVVAKVAEAPEYRVTVADLVEWEREHGRIPKKSAVLLYTGWARRWGDAARYANLDAQGVPRVPGFSAAALAFLVDERQVRGVGLDAFTPDPPVVPLGAWQVENLTNLDRLPAKGAKLIVAPLRLEGPTAPARVICILP